CHIGPPPSLPEPDPRIEEGVTDVDRNQATHQDDGVDKVQTLNNRIVQVVDRVNQISPHARDNEDLLKDHRTGDDVGKEHATDDRYYGDQSVTESVLVKDGVLAQTFSVSRTDIVLTKHFQHLCADQSDKTA